MRLRHAGLLLALLLPLVLGAAAVLAAPEFPPLTGRVVDGAGVLPAPVAERLSAELERHERATSNQVVVATLASLQGYDIADYGYRLLRHWRIGQAGRDNGVLLLVAPAERRVRIEVGYGLEGVLTDALSHDIIQTRILPAFRDGDFAGGIEAGTAAILSAIEGSYEPLSRRPAPAWVPILPFLVFVLASVLLSRYRRAGRRRRRGGMLLPGAIGYGIGRGHGGFGDGGSGGGGFSGGGGSAGGGGASGSW